MRSCNEISHRLIVTVKLLFILIYGRKDFQERIKRKWKLSIPR
nr:MAG TPA: hypothetical protein [Caudoviricetes sp.]